MESWDGNGRSQNEPQAQGAEEHEGGVHDVQAAQATGQQEDGEAEVQPDQTLARYRGPVRGRERIKKLELTIANCQDCPFLVVYTRDIKIDDITLDSGFYCIYQNAMGGRTQQDMTIVTHEQLHDDSKDNNFRGWLMEHEGALVPRSCPLPDIEEAAPFTGKRALDIGPID